EIRVLVFSRLFSELGRRRDQVFVCFGRERLGVGRDNNAFHPIGASGLDIQVQQTLFGVSKKLLGFVFGRAGRRECIWIISTRHKRKSHTEKKEKGQPQLAPLTDGAHRKPPQESWIRKLVGEGPHYTMSRGFSRLNGDLIRGQE